MLIKDLGLPNITQEEILKNISKSKWKLLVKKAIKGKCETELKNEIQNLKKLKDGPMQNECFNTKQYLKEYQLEDARLFFKYRSKMLDFKFNYKSNPLHSKDLWKCDSCRTNIDTQSHMLWCQAYKELRIDKDLQSDKDLTKYIQEVLEIRMKMNLIK